MHLIWYSFVIQDPGAWLATAHTVSTEDTFHIIRVATAVLVICLCSVTAQTCSSHMTNIRICVIQARDGEMTECKNILKQVIKQAESCAMVDFFLTAVNAYLLCASTVASANRWLLIQSAPSCFDRCATHNTLFSMDVTDTNTIWTLPTAMFTINPTKHHIDCLESWYSAQSGGETLLSLKLNLCLCANGDIEVLGLVAVIWEQDGR